MLRNISGKRNLLLFSVSITLLCWLCPAVRPLPAFSTETTTTAETTTTETTATETTATETTATETTATETTDESTSSDNLISSDVPIISNSSSVFCWGPTWHTENNGILGSSSMAQSPNVTTTTTTTTQLQNETSFSSVEYCVFVIQPPFNHSVLLQPTFRSVEYAQYCLEQFLVVKESQQPTSAASTEETPTSTSTANPNTTSVAVTRLCAEASFTKILFSGQLMEVMIRQSEDASTLEHFQLRYVYLNATEREKFLESYEREVHGEEMDSMVFTVPTEANATTTCAPFEWLCADGSYCIHENWVCDGTVDCQDGSDEMNCSAATLMECGGMDMMQCVSGAQECIPESNWCDGIIDCQDGSDELDCPNSGATVAMVSENSTPQLDSTEDIGGDNGGDGSDDNGDDWGDNGDDTEDK